ncbi:MAG: flavodoxin family protein [Thermodesulfobacteriota bacterium]|jgi:multimeric flavodoxin WrbA
MKVLGVSGSPVKESNTDRAVKAVLAAIGCETEFVKLSEYTVAPCRACLGCVETNQCVIEDDGVMLAEKAKQADALVIGGYTPYSTLDSRTKAFIERLYPLRHQRGIMAGKPGAAVVTCCVSGENPMLPPAGQMGVNAIQFYMMEEGMEFVGALTVQGNVPCVKCGHGDVCAMSGIKMLYGPEASVESVGIQAFEDTPTNLATATELGRSIARALVSKRGSDFFSQERNSL